MLLRGERKKETGARSKEQGAEARAAEGVTGEVAGGVAGGADGEVGGVGAGAGGGKERARTKEKGLLAGYVSPPGQRLGQADQGWNWVLGAYMHVHV